VASDGRRRSDSIAHPLEKELNASARDILDAIQSGFRARVDVKGKLAELHLYRSLRELETRGLISELQWSDKDGDPDFFLKWRNRRLSIQCKNVRSGDTYRTGARSGQFKVELQKTRGGLDPNTGEKTRYYRPDEFDIVAVCLFNQTGSWEFLYAAARELARHRKHRGRLEVFHPVPRHAAAPWQRDIRRVLDALSD